MDTGVFDILLCPFFLLLFAVKLTYRIKECLQILQ